MKTFNLFEKLWEHGRTLRRVGLVLVMCIIAIPQMWALNSTLTKGETIFFYKEKNNDAWRESACVQAWFNASGTGGSVHALNWLCNSTSDSEYKCWWAIVPSDDLNRITLQRFSEGCGSYWNDEGNSNQSNRSDDSYNVVYSTNYTSGWKNATFSFGLKTDVNSWGDPVATFVDKGEGLFQCTYTFTAGATSQKFKVLDCWGHWYGQKSDGGDYVLKGLIKGNSYTVIASFYIQDCDANNGKTSLSVMVVHKPGVYVATTGDGYSQTLTTWAGGKYEVYASTKSSNDNYIWGGTSSSSESDKRCVGKFTKETEGASKWMHGYISSNSNGTFYASSEHPACGNKMLFKDNSGKIGYLEFCVTGYDSLSIRAKDGGSKKADNKYLKVIINGTDVAIFNGSEAIRRYKLTASQNTIIRFEGQSSTASELYSIALRPSKPTITASSLSGATYYQGDASTNLSVTASPVVTGATLTYQWYSNTTASNSGGTEVDGATSATFAPPTTSIGTTYYYCVISESGCNTTTSSVSGAITVNAAVCAAPTGLSAGSVTAKGVTFTITDAANTNDYEIVCKTTSGTPAADATPTYTSTDKTKVVTDLVAGTTYYAWVRSKCSASNKSDWVSGGNFPTSTVTVTHTLTNVTHTSGATSSIGGSDYTAVFTANTGYSMPNPTVTIGGNAATSGTHYTWSVDGSVGTITIPANKINGDIAITINSAVAAPSSVAISGDWLYFAGETIELTATPTGGNGPVTYQWYKGGKTDGDEIDGATSATYSKASCAYEDAGSYYCKVTCGGSASTWGQSGDAYDVKIPRLYVKTGRNDGVKSDFGNVDFTRASASTATASISLGSNWDYCFNIADGCGHYYGNAGTMQYNSYGPWVTNVNNQDCGLRTTNGATYVFTINYSNWTQLTTTVTFPSSDQAADKIIYFDNQTVAWSTLHYRIGRADHTQATPMTKVPGTNNLYTVTTAAYSNAAGWHIANNAGWTGSNSIYRTYTNGDEYSITYATAHEGAAVTESAVTVTPTTSRGEGGDAGINDNCEFYNYTITTGMKTQNVAISDYSNGTITVNYTNTSNVASTLTSGNADLAHSVILTSITAVPNTGYDASAITINGGAYSANYVVTGNTTIAATFTPHVYSITYLDQGGSAFSGTHTDTPSAHPTSHTYNTATNLNGATKAGYTFGGWYTSSDCSTGLVASLGATDYTADITLYAKWTEDVAPCPTGGDIFTLEMTYSGGSAVKVAANSTLAMTATHGTATGGTVTFGNQNGSSNDKMQIKKPGIAYINGDDAYIRIDFSCPIKTGDVLTFTSDENKEISFTTTDTRSTSVKTSSKKWTVTKAFNDATTLYIWRGSSSSVNLHTINIVRPVTVTFDKNGGSSVSPSSATYDGTSSCVLAETSRTDYHLDGWNTRADGSGDDLGLPGEVYHLDDVTTSTTTVYAIWSAKSCASGTLYKFQVNTGLTNGGLPHQQEVYVKTSDFLSIMTGGYLKAYNSSSSSDYIAITDNSRICIGNSSSYLLVQLDCPLRAGDKIKSTVTTQTLYVTKADVSRTSTVTLPIAANNEQTIPEALVGATELKIWSGSSNGGKISYFEIIRSASTYNVTYDGNDQTSAAGTVPTDATNYAYNATVTTAAQGSLAKTNYTFGGWNTANDGTGTNTAAGSTFSITDNTTLYAKWTQAVTFDANTSNHGSAGGSATAVWNATALTGITHATPVSGYKLLGYYTTASGDGVKVLNSDGSFASSNVTYYITSGKWSRTDEAPTLYARYESSGSLIWNLGVNTDATSLTTSSKNSDFPQIAVANMTNAALTGISYSKSKKSELTGIIETPTSYDGAKYVSVTFQVAAGYKFTPSSVNVKVQPKDNAKTVKIELSDASSHSQDYTSGSQEAGSIHTVTMTGNGTFYTGTVTLKIYCYGASGGYRLGTPISIEGEVEATCVMPSFDGLNYEQTSYSLEDDASAITVTNPANVTTYAWKQNTTNDRSGTTPASGTNNTASYTPPTSAAGTLYYWCELTNACGTVKTPAVGITVSATKSDATISWTGTSASANYGGGGYTVKATVNETGWNGNAADLTLSAPVGIRIYDIVSGTADGKKYVQASFDVTTAFDRETYSTTIPFTVSADATATYNAISDEHAVSYEACTGAGEGDSYNIRMRKVVTKDGNYYHCANTDGWISANISSSHSTTKASSTMATVFDTVASSNTQYVWVRTYHADIKKVRIYADFRADNMTVANVYKSTNYFSADSKYAVDYTAIYNGDEGNDDLGDAAQGYVDIELDNVMAANDVLLVAFSTNRVRPLGAVITEGSAGSLTTTLTWSGGISDGAIVSGKTQSSANFTYTASLTGANSNSLGAITYTSSNTSCATVDPSTGEVTITASGASNLSTTIKATLAASGCYKPKSITYSFTIPGVTCEVNHGTLSSDVTSKCETGYATLTLTDFESDASVQWYNGETPISNGSTYAITTEGTTSTMVTRATGTYSVMVTNATSTCSDRSNSITITNKSTSVHVTRLVKEWYIKNGRLTPDIALWELGDDCSFVSVAASGSWDTNTGLTAASSFYEEGGIVYLKGTEPKANAGVVQDYTLTLTVNDGCGNQTLNDEGKKITIHHQQNTDKHVLAFVVNGTAKGGFTDGITAAQTTSVGLYNAIAANFDVLATNIYATDDEKKLKEYYSQYDILCITDYPNTQTKGANSKSYVDAIGSLIDIRPILTMEAFVSALPNWKLKGVSGNPKSPTTRQYTMDLQCKDHEIFAGTDLTKVGEGDEAMYRVSMVDNTKEDYATLDATYGGGAHAEKEGYQYGKKPALQGFTFTQEMSDNDLLPIGLINDGAGNPLQVGIERQHNMEARLMVLGINSYAMERLTDDGERVVINALNYLMKKNAEDIADCSTSFVGGAEGDEENWDNANNWTGNTVPDMTQKVRILAPCVIPNSVKAHVAGVVIAPHDGGMINHGADEANGSLTIEAGGALIVDGKVEAATAPNYFTTRATTPADLVLQSNSSAQAALILDNSKGETQATVVVRSKANKDEGTRNWQYLTSPLQETPVTEFFYGVGTYTYKHSEADGGWVRYNLGTTFHAFDAIGLTQEAAKDFVFYGPLAPTGEWELNLTNERSGNNLFGNSWTAPIDLKALVRNTDFDSNINLDLAIYNTGADKKIGEVFDQAPNADNTPGTWHHIPLELATLEDAGWMGLTVIPAYQAFQLKATASATLTIDYDKCVRGSESKNYTEPLRAPRRRSAGRPDSEIEALRLAVSDANGVAYIYLLEGEQFTEGYDNGWELEYKPNSKYGKLYAISPEQGDMMALARPSLEGTMVGFQPGESSEYTITFNETDGYYYLNDLKMEQSTLIQAGESYTFSVEEGESANRFLISSVPFNKPGIVTGVTNPDAEAPKAQKVIYNDKLYIIRGGKVFSADGQLVK